MGVGVWVFVCGCYLLHVNCIRGESNCLYIKVTSIGGYNVVTKTRKSSFGMRLHYFISIYPRSSSPDC